MLHDHAHINMIISIILIQRFNFSFPILHSPTGLFPENLVLDVQSS